MKANPKPWLYGPNWQGIRCEARTRRGTACQRPARLPVGRCKLHGGASTGPRTGGYCGTTQGLWSINQKQYSLILGPWSLVQGPKLLDRKFHPGVFSFGFLPLCKTAVRPSRRSTQYPSHRWSIFFRALSDKLDVPLVDA